MVVAQLHFVRMRVETGSAITDATARQAVMARIDDVRADVAAAERALAQLPRPDLDLAARHLAHIQFLLSQSWRRQLAGIAADASLVGAIVHAANFDTEQLRNQLAAGIRATAPELVRRSGESFGLTCAACAADAVTCTVTRGADGEAQQVMVSSVSPVTVFRSLAGTRMQDLLALLEAGDGEGAQEHVLALPWRDASHEPDAKVAPFGGGGVAAEPGGGYGVVHHRAGHYVGPAWSLAERLQRCRRIGDHGVRYPSREGAHHPHCEARQVVVGDAIAPFSLML